jgi:MinD-like ATPase involved in chromosome partitioning or flagellar assembly
VTRIIGRKLEVRVPSDVEVTRSVNDGRPIVLSRPKSHAAQSYRKLADLFMERVAPAPLQPAEEKRDARPQRLQLRSRRPSRGLA